MKDLRTRELELELEDEVVDAEERDDDDDDALMDDEADIFELDENLVISGEEIEEEEDEDEYDLAASSSSGIPAHDTIGLYFKEMGSEPLLTQDEEVELGRAMVEGVEARQRLAASDLDADQREALERIAEQGREARLRLVRANARLVVSIAKRYRGLGMPFSDLIQAGNMGLLKAVDKFDYQRGVKFGTYATWWIRQSVVRSLNEQGRVIRLSVHMSDRLRQLHKVSQQLEQSLGCQPTPEQVAEAVQLHPDQVRRLFQLSQQPLSLDLPVGEDEESEFGEFVEDTDVLLPDEYAEAQMLAESLASMLAELTPREARVLRMRYGLDGNEPHTLKDMGDKLGLSRERIRQIEQEALRKLRHPRHARSLRHYL
ncbi:MAG: sigma-70 family RNA polymerase sigma factor [Anaerolineales bacterium]|nr:sigma-70 family RNA polymerase sigma factor [Anaerolineales bacterium]